MAYGVYANIGYAYTNNINWFKCTVFMKGQRLKEHYRIL